MCSRVVQVLLCSVFFIVTTVNGSPGLFDFVGNIFSSRDPCYSSPLDLQDPISDLVLKIIHEIQSHMHDGIPSMGIPPLDPLNITEYAFDVNDPSISIKAYGKLRDVLVKNLSSFNVTNIKTNIFKRSVNVSIKIPNLLVEGNYVLKGKVLSFFPIMGNGPFTLIPQNTIATVSAELGFSDGHFVLNYFDYKVGIAGIYAKFQGIYGSKVLSEILNKILDAFGATLFGELEPLVHGDIRDILIKDINKILKDIKFSDITNSVSAFSSRFLCA